MSAVRTAFVLLTLAAAAPASAHPGGTTAYAQLTVSGQTVRYSLSLADASMFGVVTTESLDRLGAAIREKVVLTSDGERCVPAATHARPPASDSRSATAIVDFACRRPVRELVIRDDLPDALGADLHTLAKIEWEGGMAQFAFASESREARVEVGGSDRPTAGVASFFLLGVEHIVTGYDHLLFLLVLVMGGGGLWPLVRIVTAFTIAHSLTLALGVLGVVTIHGRWIEAAIALTIAWVAAENLLARRALGHRWALAFVFGLVHGLGFAGALREIALPPSNLAGALAAFNIGVEAGQLALVLPLAAIVLRVRERPWQPRLAAAISVFALAVGLALFVDRIASAS